PITFIDHLPQIPCAYLYGPAHPHHLRRKCRQFIVGERGAVPSHLLVRAVGLSMHLLRECPVLPVPLVHPLLEDNGPPREILLDREDLLLVAPEDGQDDLVLGKSSLEMGLLAEGH